MSAARKESAICVDILVIGGGTAGTVAAIKAKEALPDGEVLLLEKANVKRSGAIALGMDGVNNAVVPGHATPEQYVKEITMANDGIVNQRAVLAYARQSFGMIQELESWGVKFQRTLSGDYDVKKVHHKGSYVLPVPEGYDIKKILTRVIRQTGVKVENRVIATRILLDEGRAAGALGFNVRTGEFVVIRAKAVILACGGVRKAWSTRFWISDGHLRKSGQCGGRLCDGLSCGRGVDEHRVLSGQSVAQGLQRSGVRLRQRTFWRLHGEREGKPFHALELLERADDVGVLSRTPSCEWSRLSQDASPCA
jgi:succinate dehydrogenase/fumarate reductase flavoprotein subunit